MPPNNQSLSLCNDLGAKPHQQLTTPRSVGRLPGNRLLNWLPGGKAFKAAYTAAASNS
jgi:hypothetical protein